MSSPDLGSAGRGELNYAATWDEFPNGRFGDFKSPAYGVQNLWDGGLGVKVDQSLRLLNEIIDFLCSRRRHARSGDTQGRLVT